MGKSYVHVSWLLRDAWYESIDYISVHMEEVVKHYERNGIYQIFLKNGDSHYFMNYYTYAKWCKGRTYYNPYGVEFRSGYEVKI